MEEILTLILESEMWGRILPSALAIFAGTQFVKITARVVDFLPVAGPHILRLVAGALAYPLTRLVMEIDGNVVSHWALPLPHMLIAWGLAHVLAERGMAILYWWKPDLARLFNADRRKTKADLPEHEERRKRK